jgi:nucleoid-associated protein YgaU
VPDLRKARFKVFEANGSETALDVQFNPNSLTFDKKPKVADIPIPGLDAPLKQFVRGETETLSVELFFDTTEKGTGAGATSVTTLTDAFYGLVKIDPKTHAPPICSFLWGSKFPGDSLPDRHGNQRRTEFKGVVKDVKQDFQLFSPEGTPLRAVLTVAIDEYRPLHEQINQLNLQSPDHHRVHVLERDETLALVSHLHLDNAAEWRHVAVANGLDDPRRLDPGRTLSIPPIR